MTRFIFVDGKPAAAVHALDRGLQFGDGLFETLAVVDGRVRLQDKHLARLRRGCEQLAIEAPNNRLLRSELAAAAERLSHGVIKLIVTRGSGSRGYRLPAQPVSRRILIGSDWPSFPGRLRLVVCKTRLAAGGSLAGLKHLNRLEQVLACAEWQEKQDVDEGLMLDPDGNVIEATSANVFVVRNDQLTTPALQRCGVAGVMREQVIALARQSGRVCETSDIVLEDVLAADEVFLTNSICGIRAAVSLQDRTWETGPVTNLLGDMLTRQLSMPSDEDAN